jgi:hypothetical protein
VRDGSGNCEIYRAIFKALGLVKVSGFGRSGRLKVGLCGRCLCRALGC